MINALSIDLEDWFCANNITEAIGRSAWDSCELRVTGSTKSILEVLATHGTKATFFVLGWIAERVPELVDEIERQGHEIATHGYSHTLLTHMTPESFADDLGRALEVTKRGPDREIIGFRAPSFTLVDSTRWALDVMADLGIEYDSSMFPIGFHPDYGIPDAPLSVHRPTERIVEFPLSCAELMGRRIPCSGGGYFRILPYAVTKSLLRRCNRQGRPVVFYLHPWEVDPGQPRVELSRQRRIRHYINQGRTLKRLDRLLADFEFTSVRKVLGL